MATGDTAQATVRSYVAIAPEASWGTYASATASFQALDVQSCGFVRERISEKLDQITTNRGFSKRVQLDNNTAGPMEQYLHAKESVLAMASALGGGIATSSVSAGFSHLLKSGNFDQSISSVSFNVRKGSSFPFRYIGGRVNSVTISANAGELATVSYEYIFKDGTQLSEDLSAELVSNSLNPFTFVEGSFAYSGASECITGFELVINNNLVTDQNARCLGQRTLKVLPATRREIEFKINQRFDTTTTLQRFLDATSAAVQLVFDSGETIGAASAETYKCTIDLAKVYQNTSDPELGGSGDILTSEIGYDVVVDAPHTSTGYDLQFTFVNDVSAY